MSNNKLTPPSIEALIEFWEKDSEIDRTDPGREILRIPLLHNKYNKFLSLHNLASLRYSIEYNNLKKIKWQYYSGKLDADDLQKYGWEPFRLVLKSDIGIYLDGDEDLNKLKSKQAYHIEAVSFCTNVMKELNNRTWQLREYMTHDRFIAGQH